MTTKSILGIFFLIELALVASALSVYLFFQLKRIKLKFSAHKSAAEAAAAAAEEIPTLHDLFDMQITRTRKRLTENISTKSEEENQKQRSLLTQRIEFLKFEKEILAEHVTDQTYWQKVCDHIASVVSKSKPETQEDQTEPQAIDESVYKRRIANYQKQLEDLRGEFDSYRKYSNKLASSLSAEDNDSKLGKETDKLLSDFKEQEKHLHARLNKLQNDNIALQTDVEAADFKAYIKEQKAQKGSIELNANTASEEEINHLREIISRQYVSIDELRAAVTNSQEDTVDSQKVAEKILAVEQSQEELKVCAEILETENQRLMQELETSRAQAKLDKVPAAPPKELFDLRLQTKELNDEVTDLNQQISEKDQRILELIAEHDSLQKEFMQMYTEHGN